MPAIGRLDQQITFQRAATVKNALNEQQQVWSDYFTCYARKRDWSDGEAVAAGQLGSFLRARFVVRSSPETTGLSPADRLAHAGELWSIHGIKETADGRNRFLEITAVKDNDAMGAYTPPPPDPVESEGSEGLPISSGDPASSGGAPSEGVPMLTASFYPPTESFPTVAATDNNPYTMGQIFQFSKIGKITKLRFRKPLDSFDTQRSWAIWPEGSDVLLFSKLNLVDSARVDGWVECDVVPPLDIGGGGIGVMVAATTTRYFTTPEYFSSPVGITRGPITSPFRAGRYKGGAALAKPDAWFNDAAYYFDVVFEYEEE